MDEVAGKDTSSHKIAAKMNETLPQATPKTSPATVNRWRQQPDSRPDANKVVDFCRAYGENPIVGLVKAGYITESEARTAVLALMSLDELLAEVKAEGERRAKGGTSPYSEQLAGDLAAEIERRTKRRS